MEQKTDSKTPAAWADRQKQLADYWVDSVQRSVIFADRKSVV